MINTLAAIAFISLTVMLLSLASVSAVDFPVASVTLNSDKVPLSIGFSKNAFPGGKIESDYGAALVGWTASVKKQSSATISPSITILNCVQPETTVKKINKDRPDILGLTVLDYAVLKDMIDYIPSFVTLGTGDERHISFRFIVPAEDKITSILQLKDYALNIPVDVGGAIAMLWVETLLRKEGVSYPGSFFGKVVIDRFYSASRAMFDIYFGKKQAMILTEGTYRKLVAQNNSLTSAVTTLDVLPHLVYGVVCIRSDLRGHKLEVIKTLFSARDAMPESEMMFGLLEVREMAPFTDDYVKPLLKLTDEYFKLCPPEALRPIQLVPR